MGLDKFRGFVIVYGFKNEVVIFLEEFIDLEEFKFVVESVNYMDGL